MGMAVTSKWHLQSSPIMYMLRVFTFFAVSTVFILGLILLMWNSDSAITGRRHWILNRYYSMRSLHTHYMLADPENFDNAVVPNIPTKWNSLGMILSDSDQASPYTAYHQATQSGQMPHYWECKEQANSQFASSSKCLLELMTPTLLMKNGESISILSNVTPALYLLTLITVYLLSATRMVSMVVADGVVVVLGYNTRDKLFKTRRLVRRYARW